MIKQIDVFVPEELSGIRLNNRILRSATDEGMADSDGNPTEKLIKLYENLAKGGIGGIITGYMSVSKDGTSTMPGMVMIESDNRITKLTEVVNRVHQMSAPIICQIAHCGRNGVAGKAFNVNRISEDTIERVINDFTNAVIRAEKAGFDGVELHLAHGYFLSEMISGHTNKRRDKWGGSIENRTRIVKELMNKIRIALPNYPILIKMNGDEIYSDGIHSDEAVQIAKLLELFGVNAIEVSCGIDWKQMGPSRGEIPVEMIINKFPGIKDMPKPVKAVVRPILPRVMKEVKTEKKYNVPSAKKIKESVKIPVIVVGGIHDLEDIESTINQDGIDYVSMSRPLILEPGLINKFKEHKAQTAKCLSCNYCLIGLYNDPLRCYYGKVAK
ncbi:NADH:flavin oxidoreductase [Anaeromicropila herbilytica]|uniref:NADH:flavin oxidoreductase n=1 Tax=Anaeromicropila herbilytica TaxID=2785025 RepID=A0A7R7ELS3_9FIRM|nr:NADH:flavin oxidoreductase [Anaeromicropila herbilytica]BCN30961.1 NADH:flavin oxidoreductase [Anaeromicropila herbilytica]